MQPVLHYRNDIPFYYDKSAEEFYQDPYERYDPMVIRQSMLHLSDHLLEMYPMQPIKDYIERNWPIQNPINILEIGCGVGRMIGDIASQFPSSNCWGIDYSYQMLKRAKEAWIDSKAVEMDFSKFGFEKEVVQNIGLSNLQFGLAKCEYLPFDDGSQDLVFSTFLLDRLSDPIQGLKEMKRVLSDEGHIIIVSPLNFKISEQWKQFYPISNLKSELLKLGIEIASWQDDIRVSEPLDIHGNYIEWNCIATVLVNSTK